MINWLVAGMSDPSARGKAPATRQEKSMHPPTSVTIGAPTQQLAQQIGQVMTTRLHVSSESTIKTAVNKWWLPYIATLAVVFAFDGDFIPVGHASRGAIMAGFAIYIASCRKFGTAQSYVWAICEYHIQKLGIVGNPLDNVVDWARFMSALEVQSWVDSSVEPREMVPFLTMVRALKHLDRNDFESLALGVILLMMYYTMSRSETPVPKARTGQNGFNPNQHIRRCDVRLLEDKYVEWGFGSIKQDKRSKRARRDPTKREWKPVGLTTGILSMNMWLAEYITMGESLGFWPKGGQDDSPFFLHSDGSFWTYGELLTAFRAAMMKIDGMTEEQVKKYGLHGLRVLGYNCWCAAEGEDVAKLQGGWGSDCHRQYGREMLEKILSFAQKGADYAAGNSLPHMPLDANSSHQAVFRSDSTYEVRELPDSDDEDEGEDEQEGEEESESEGEEELEEGCYIVEAILSYSAGKRKYLVSWEGYDDSHNSWETKTNLKHNKIFKKYLADQATSSGGPGAAGSSTVEA